MVGCSESRAEDPDVVPFVVYFFLQQSWHSVNKIFFILGTLKTARSWILREVVCITGYDCASQGERETGCGEREMMSCHVTTLEISMLFLYFTFGIVEPHSDPVPPKKLLAEKGSVLTHLAFFLLIVSEKLFISWANIESSPYARLSFRYWVTAVNKVDEFLVSVRHTVLEPSNQYCSNHQEGKG